MSRRRLVSATCMVPTGTTGKLGTSPRLYRALRCDPHDPATRILIETETLLGIYGHRKIRVADVADACGFSAANVYRYFSSRGALLDTLASHYLREAERTALAGAACRSSSARDRLGGFLIGLNTALTSFSDSSMTRWSFAASQGSSPQRAHPESSGSRVMPCRKPGA